MKKWPDYWDKNGLVVQKVSMGGDGGDSLNRTCAETILKYLKNPGSLAALLSYSIVVLTVSNGKGKYRRSNHLNKWYSDWDRTSRDQLTPLVIMLGLFNMEMLWPVFKDHLKRLLLFTYNTRRNHVYKTLEDHRNYSTPDVAWNYAWKLPDITGPEFWALYIRGFHCKLLLPWLYLCDLHTLLGSVVIRFNKQDDVINHALILEYAKVRMDTPVMWLARKITPRSLLQERLDAFFGKEIEPPINELYRELKYASI